MSDLWKILDIIMIICISTVALNSTELSQKFSEFGEYSQVKMNSSILSSTPMLSPIPLASIKRGLNNASNIGFRLHPIYKVNKLHKGIDLAAETGTKVIATCYAKVVFAGNRADGYGNQIELVSKGYVRGEMVEYYVRYAHLSKIYIQSNATVQFGEIIGSVGSTGRSTGPHLHYEIYRNGELQDPLPYIRMDTSIFRDV